MNERISKLIMLLGSEKDGEVLNAARALHRELKTQGKDWHDLAKAWERGTPPQSIPNVDLALVKHAVAMFTVGKKTFELKKVQQAVQQEVPAVREIERIIEAIQEANLQFYQWKGLSTLRKREIYDCICNSLEHLGWEQNRTNYKWRLVRAPKSDTPREMIGKGAVHDD
jgi:hypothetical protein